MLDNQLVPDHRKELLDISFSKVKEKTATNSALKSSSNSSKILKKVESQLIGDPLEALRTLSLTIKIDSLSKWLTASYLRKTGRLFL